MQVAQIVGASSGLIGDIPNGLLRDHYLNLMPSNYGEGSRTQVLGIQSDKTETFSFPGRT